MQHLFYVHSAITLLLARAVIQHEGLDAGRIAWLTDRGVTVPNVPAERVLEVSDWQWQSLSHRAQNADLLRRLDDWLSTRFGDAPFRCYLPHHLLRTLRAVISHPRCAGYAYLEEGLDSYQPLAQLADIHQLSPPGLPARLAHRIKFHGRIPAERAFLRPESTRFHGAYCLSPEAFPDLPAGRKTVLPSPFQRRPEYAHYRHVLAPSPESEVGYYPLADQLLVVERLLRALAARGVAGLHVKYHPRQLRPGGSAPAFRALFERLSDLLPVTEIAPDHSLEEIAVSSGATFYVGTSSVGLYAAVSGCPVYSYAPWLTAQNSVYRTVEDRMPPAFRRLVNPISALASHP